MRTPVDPRPCRTLDEVLQARAARSVTVWASAPVVREAHDLEVMQIESEAVHSVLAFPVARVSP